jgi:hypothetical protein
VKRAVALLLVAAACSSSHGDSSAAVAITHVPRTYVVIYRVDSGGSTSEQTISVRRPFDGRVVSGDSVSVSSFARLLLSGQGSQGGVLAQPPAPPFGDVRFDVALADGLERGFVERLDTTAIAGRRCQRYRTALPPGSAHLQLLVKGGDSVVSCVDADGLVLEERTTAGGKVIRRQTASSVRVDVRIADSTFATSGEPTPVFQGGGSVRRLTNDSRTPGDFWDLASAPSGFVHRGRYAVVPPQPGGFQPGHEGERIAGVIDVYTRGADVLLVDRGGSVGGGAPYVAEPVATDVDLGDLGRGELLLGLLANEVRVRQPGGHYVRVSGTVKPKVLVDVARAMRAVPGGTLTIDDSKPL